MLKEKKNEKDRMCEKLCNKNNVNAFPSIDIALQGDRRCIRRSGEGRVETQGKGYSEIVRLSPTGGSPDNSTDTDMLVKTVLYGNN